MALAGSKAASRHQRILALIGQRGYVSNEELAREFEVTVQTVRRDVNALAEGEKFMSAAGLEVSDDGNLLAFGTDTTGFRE